MCEHETMQPYYYTEGTQAYKGVLTALCFAISRAALSREAVILYSRAMAEANGGGRVCVALSCTVDPPLDTLT